MTNATISGRPPEQLTKADWVKVECPNIGEEITCLSHVWKLNGPHKKHKFLWIDTATVCGWGIKHQTIIRHYVEGDQRNDIKWGHDIMYAFNSSRDWRENRPGEWATCLLAARVLTHDLPCCGGEYRSEKEVTDYSCCSYGHCGFCKVQWIVGDGYQFIRRNWR
jgi:hypothetical protein